MTELHVEAKKLQQAKSYLDVFGPCNGTTAEQNRYIKGVFRQIAKTVHPDRYSDDADKKVANEAFSKLQTFFENAQKAVAERTYGQRPSLATAKTEKGEHFLVEKIGGGDLCEIYECRSVIDGKEVNTVAKLTVNPDIEEILENERSTISELRATGTNPEVLPYFPKVLDACTFKFRKGGLLNKATILEKLEGMYNLKQVRETYPNGIDQLDVVWIWRRILFAMARAHSQRIVHGSLVPENVMIYPEDHGVVLIDWCCACSTDTYPGDHVSDTPLYKVISLLKDWYPEEVKIEHRFPNTATDIYMAALCMVYALGGDPATKEMPKSVNKRLRLFFKGCLQEKQLARPQDALELLKEFDELLKDLGEPFYPRSFHKFSMPQGTE